MRSIIPDYAANYTILEAHCQCLENMRSFGIMYFGPFSTKETGMNIYVEKHQILS